MNVERGSEKRDQGRARLQERVVVLVLFACAIVCYANTLGHAFVYDDEQQILQNPYVKSWYFLPEIFTTTVWSFLGGAGASNYYRPLMTLTYLLLYKTFGNVPAGFHLFNILLNALVVIAVYYAGRDLLRDRLAGTLAALLFAVHPVHSEAVNWVAAVPDLESTFFVVVAFGAYGKSTGIRPWRGFFIAAAFFLGVLAKEPALMLAPLLVLYEHFVRRDRGNIPLAAKFRRYFPVCLAAVVYLIGRVLLLGNFAPVLQHPEVNRWQAVYSSLALVAQYTGLLFWPARLSAFHLFHPSNSFLLPSVLAGFAIVAAAMALIGYCYRKNPQVAFAVLWTGLTLAPVLNCRWMATNVLAERYLYLPSVGFCWIAGWALSGIYEALRQSARWRATARVALAAGMLAVFVLASFHTFVRNRDWRDDLSLYRQTLRTDPDSYIMHLNLGTAYEQNGNYAGAEKELKLALALKPDSVNVLNAMGSLYLGRGQAAEAESVLAEATRLKPQWSDPHFNSGRALEELGSHERAREEFRKAVEVAPLNATARYYWAQELEKDGQLAEAANEYQISLRLGPSLEAGHGLVDVLLKGGRSSEAEKELRILLASYAFDGMAHFKLAKLLESEGRWEEAIGEYRLAMDTDELKARCKEAIDRLTRKQSRATDASKSSEPHKS